MKNLFHLNCQETIEQCQLKKRDTFSKSMRESAMREYMYLFTQVTCSCELNLSSRILTRSRRIVVQQSDRQKEQCFTGVTA